MSENPNGVTVTFKGGTGFEQPWIVIHAESAEKALEQINNPALGELQRRTSDIATFFHGLRTAQGAFPAAKSEPVKQDAPAPQQGGWNAPAQNPPSWAQPEPAAQQASQPPAPSCIHGQRTYRSGTGRKGAWQAWMCPTPKGTPGQCEPEWIK